MSKKKKKLTAGLVVGRVILVFFTTVIALVLVVAVALGTIIKGPSVTARDTFVSTVLESGNLKFLAHIFLSDEEIDEIVAKTSMGAMDEEQDTDLIDITGEVAGNFDENGIEVVKISGSSYFATLLIIKDPSQVKVGSTYNNGWSTYGMNLDELVENAGAIAGVNGGLYAADGNRGGSPYGVCVSNGVIQYNDPSSWVGTYMIGLDNNNLLRIKNIYGMTSDDFANYVQTEGIRDAVAFQEESSDENNHFVTLVLNGEARELNGTGSGSNPRTAIGQREDGAILLLVTDGRGSSGHLGATAADLISIMLKYGAVNAANLDGGSSSCMYYDGTWLMNSVTLWAANESWRLPTAFVVMGAK